MYFLISSTIDNPVCTVTIMFSLFYHYDPLAGTSFCIDYLHLRMLRITLTISYPTNNRYDHSHRIRT